MKAAFIVLFIPVLALAGVVVTERAGIHELRRRGATDLIGTYPNHAACVAAIPVPTAAGLTEYTCKAVTHVDVRATCTDVPPPSLPVDADGFTIVGELMQEACPAGSRSHYRLFTMTPVRDEALFPTCWESRRVEILSCNPPPDFLMPGPYVWDIPPDPGATVTPPP